MASNAVVLVDAACQYSCPSSAAALPNPFRSVRVIGVFEALIGTADIVLIFKAHQRPTPRPLSPPPLFAKSALRVRRRPPPSLLIARPWARSSLVRSSRMQGTF